MSSLIKRKYLMVQKLVLEKILEMSIVTIPRLLVEGEEALVDPLLEVQGGLQGLQWRGPLHAAWLGDVLEITKKFTINSKNIYVRQIQGGDGLLRLFYLL
jgi:hypothetical protein